MRKSRSVPGSFGTSALHLPQPKQLRSWAATCSLSFGTRYHLLHFAEWGQKLGKGVKAATISIISCMDLCLEIHQIWRTACHLQLLLSSSSPNKILGTPDIKCLHGDTSLLRYRKRMHQAALTLPFPFPHHFFGFGALYALYHSSDFFYFAQEGRKTPLTAPMWSACW